MLLLSRRSTLSQSLQALIDVEGGIRKRTEESFCKFRKKGLTLHLTAGDHSTKTNKTFNKSSLVNTFRYLGSDRYTLAQRGYINLTNEKRTDELSV